MVIIPKENYTILCPQASLMDITVVSAITDEMERLWEKGHSDFIIDLQQCNNANKKDVHAFTGIHENSYSSGHSLVFTNISPAISRILKDEELDMLLNIAPSMQEAIDIVAMEQLERDLMGEE